MLLNEIGAPVNGITASTASPDAPDEDLEPGTWTRACKALPPRFLAPDMADGKTRFRAAGQSHGAPREGCATGKSMARFVRLSLRPATAGGNDGDPSTGSG